MPPFRVPATFRDRPTTFDQSSFTFFGSTSKPMSAPCLNASV